MKRNHYFRLFTI